MAKKKTVRRRTKPGKPGRPALLRDAATRRKLLKFIADGSTLTEAAALCGAGYETLNNEVKSDLQFAEAVRAAKIRARAKWVQTINEAAKRDWRAAAHRLACWEAKSWRPNRPSVVVNNEADEVNVQVNVGQQDRQTALLDPDYLEYLRIKAIQNDNEPARIYGNQHGHGSSNGNRDGTGASQANGHAGSIRQDSQQGQMEAGSPSPLPRSRHNGHHNGNGRLPPAPGDDAAETR